MPSKRTLARSGATSAFGPNSEAVNSLLARIAALSPEQVTSLAAVKQSTAYLAALGGAWRAARKAGLHRECERASNMAILSLPDVRGEALDRRRAGDVLAHAAIAVALGTRLESRYAEQLLAPLAQLD